MSVGWPVQVRSRSMGFGWSSHLRAQKKHSGEGPTWEQVLAFSSFIFKVVSSDMARRGGPRLGDMFRPE